MLVLSLALLSACESKTQGKRVAVPDVGGPTAMATAPLQEKADSSPTGETGQSAADALKQVKETPTTQTSEGSKSGNFYPPITSSATGEDALKEKTRALFTQTDTYAPDVEADDKFGPRYEDYGDDD